MALSKSELDGAVKTIQDRYRNYRDFRENELGFSLRKSDCGVRELTHVLRLWGAGRERPSGGKLLLVTSLH